MSTQLTWFGHACFLIETAGKRILVDPFLDDSPTAPVKSKDVSADIILITHGHFDHIADAAKIATRCDALCVSNFEICDWLSKQGVKQTDPMNTGGSISLPVGKSKINNRLPQFNASRRRCRRQSGRLLAHLARGQDLHCRRHRSVQRHEVVCRRPRPGDPSHWRPLHDGSKRLDRSDPTAQSQARRSLPLQHVAANRARRRQLGIECQERDVLAGCHCETG